MILVVFAGLALLASPGSAERPRADAASAGICGVLSGATPGLESLCVNYCEARDCPNSDARACESLLRNYNRHRRDGDPEMPCLQACPCFTAEDLRFHPAELVRCTQHVNPDFLASGIFDEIETSGAGSVSNFTGGFHDCLYSDFTVDPPIARFGGGSLDPDAVAACIAVIDAEIAARGLTCQSL
jgi:hypothetical protein